MGAKTRVITCSSFPEMYTVNAVMKPTTASGRSLSRENVLRHTHRAAVRHKMEKRACLDVMIGQRFHDEKKNHAGHS